MHSDPQRRKKVIPRRACSPPYLGPLQGDGSETEERASGGEASHGEVGGCQNPGALCEVSAEERRAGEQEHAGHTWKKRSLRLPRCDVGLRKVPLPAGKKGWRVQTEDRRFQETRIGEQPSPLGTEPWAGEELSPISVRSQRTNSLGSAGHVVSATTTLLCL